MGINDKLKQLARNRLVRLTILSILAGYFVLFIYYFSRYGIRAIGWHAHFMFLIYLGIAGYLVIRYILFRNRYHEIAEKWILTIWVLFAVELAILVLGIDKKTHVDDPDHFYWAPYVTRHRSYYHTWNADSTHHLKQQEFDYLRKTNSLGFADGEWLKEKPAGVTRILCLGDSFTEGDAAHADSSYVAFLRRSISAKYDSIEVMNAGTCGSDPYFNFKNLTDRLAAYKPDIIVQTISSHDIYSDILVRGGMERFQKADELTYRKAPWWEPIYAGSYLFRILTRIAGFDQNLMHKSTVKKINHESIAQLPSFFSEYYRFSDSIDATLLLVILPLKGEVISGEYSIDFLPLRNGLDSIPGLLWKDMMPCYQSYFKQKKLNPKDYYWVHDGHHNARGYAVMAKCIEGYLEELLTDE